MYIFIPVSNDLNQIIEVLLITPLMISFFMPKFTKQNNKNYKSINLGLIYFFTMIVIMLIGNISNFVIKFVYPYYDDYIKNANLYYLAGIIFFLIGYFLQTRKLPIKQNYHMPIKIKYIIVIFCLVLLSIYVLFISKGLIPLFSSSGIVERFTPDETSSIHVRLWSFCVVTALLAFSYHRNVNKSFLILSLFVLSFCISFFFIIRMYPFLILITVVIMLYVEIHNIKKIVIYSLLVISIFLIANMYFVDYREQKNNMNIVRTDTSLNYIQRNLFYTNFNEYVQMKTAINIYNEEPQYGKTLLSIPLGFVPAPLLSPFDVVKSEIQENNSAVIMARYLNSQSSTGIRIGIMGEFFINFSYFGCIFMVFIGMIVGILQKKVQITDIKDWRFVFYLLFFSIMLYALIGQIDVIGSLFGNYIMLFIAIYLFTKKGFIRNE